MLPLILFLIEYQGFAGPWRKALPQFSFYPVSSERAVGLYNSEASCQNYYDLPELLWQLQFLEMLHVKPRTCDDCENRYAS